jgi:hypothetical protein
MSIITAPGAYPNITNEQYHRTEICPAPSISASGLKTLLRKSPRHYWFDSCLNPNRPEEKDKAHFRIGKAIHDVLLLTDRWPQFYFTVPDGFSLAHHKKWAEEIPAYEEAVARGCTVLRQSETDTIMAMAEAIRGNEFAAATLAAGDPETTLAWQDPETGVWLRARPDFLPWSVQQRREIMAVPDLKTAADGSQRAFQRAINEHGYHMSAALYCDGIKAIFGHYPTHWLHVVLEKEPPYCVALWELPQEDIERGRWLNRFAIRSFAKCLETGKFPGYADEPSPCGLPGWQRKMIDEGITPEGLAWAEAA